MIALAGAIAQDAKLPRPARITRNRGKQEGSDGVLPVPLDGIGQAPPQPRLIIGVERHPAGRPHPHRPPPAPVAAPHMPAGELRPERRLVYIDTAHAHARYAT
jgi:hypothetical protein